MTNSCRWGAGILYFPGQKPDHDILAQTSALSKVIWLENSNKESAPSPVAVLSTQIQSLLYLVQNGQHYPRFGPSSDKNTYNKPILPCNGARFAAHYRLHANDTIPTVANWATNKFAALLLLTRKGFNWLAFWMDCPEQGSSNILKDSYYSGLF